MDTNTRTRTTILHELAEWNHIASRLTIVDTGYGDVHAEINQLLTELETTSL